MNSGSVENRQLRVFLPWALMNYDGPWVRQQFEEALAKNGLASMMPKQVCTDPDFEWDEGSK